MYALALLVQVRTSSGYAKVEASTSSGYPTVAGTNCKDEGWWSPAVYGDRSLCHYCEQNGDLGRGYPHGKTNRCKKCCASTDGSYGSSGKGTTYGSSTTGSSYESTNNGNSYTEPGSSSSGVASTYEKPKSNGENAPGETYNGGKAPAGTSYGEKTPAGTSYGGNGETSNGGTKSNGDGGSDGDNNNVLMIVFIVLGVLALLIILMIVCYCVSKRKKEDANTMRGMPKTTSAAKDVPGKSTVTTASTPQGWQMSKSPKWKSTEKSGSHQHTAE